MKNKDLSKHEGIVIDDPEKITQYASLKEYLMEAFTGGDLLKTQKTSPWDYFDGDEHTALEVYEKFEAEIKSLADWDTIHVTVWDNVKKGQVAKNDYREEVCIEMTIAAIESICKDISKNKALLGKNPEKIISKIFTENNEKRQINI